jgi:hypothetical protein
MKRLIVIGLLLVGLTPLSFAVETVDLTNPLVKKWQSMPLDGTAKKLIQEYGIPNGPGRQLTIQSVPRDKKSSIETSQADLLQRVRQNYTNYLYNILKKTETELVVEIKGIGDPEKHNAYTLQKIMMGPKGFHAISYTAEDTSERNEMIAVLGSTKIVQKKLPAPNANLTKETIEQLINRFGECLRTQNSEKLANLFSSDAIIAADNISMGKGDFLELFKKGAAQITDYQNKLTIKSVKIEGTKATAEFDMTENLTMKTKGAPPMTARSNNVVIFERKNGQVLISKFTNLNGKISMDTSSPKAAKAKKAPAEAAPLSVPESPSTPAAPAPAPSLPTTPPLSAPAKTGGALR